MKINSARRHTISLATFLIGVGMLVPFVASASGGSSFNSLVNTTTGGFGIDVGVPYEGAQFVDCYTEDAPCPTLLATSTPYTILAVGIVDGAFDGTAYLSCDSHYISFSTHPSSLESNVQAPAVYTSTMINHCSSNLLANQDTNNDGIYYWVEYVPWDTRVKMQDVTLDWTQPFAFFDFIAFAFGMCFIVWFFHKK